MLYIRIAYVLMLYMRNMETSASATPHYPTLPHTTPHYPRPLGQPIFMETSAKQLQQATGGGGGGGKAGVRGVSESVQPEVRGV